ncbi:MAG: glycosyltransferase family 9 protein [Candidatus Coatesbacteria bacterium]
MLEASPSFPDPPIGVFDAAAYRQFDPGPGRVVRAGRPVPGAPGRILVVGLTAAGDVIHFLPVVGVLRRAFPGARVEWVVQDKARAVVEGRSDLEAVHVFERHRWGRGLLLPARWVATLREILAFARALRSGKDGEGRGDRGRIDQGRCDLLIDPQGTFKSALVNLLSGAPVRVGFARGFCREGNHLSTHVLVALPTQRMHRVRKSLALLRAIGIDASGAGTMFEVPAIVQDAVDRELEAAGLVPGKFAVLHPGTSAFGARKRWPVERFGAVADRVHAEHGLVPVFALGPVERPWREDLVAGVRRAPVRVLEPASLAHLAGILRRSACLIGSDSAPLHVASALRTPVVGLYGPTDPVLFAPFYPPAVVVVQGLTCPRCGSPHCNHPVPRMEAITVDQVMEGVARLFRLTGR